MVVARIGPGLPAHPAHPADPAHPAHPALYNRNHMNREVFAAVADALERGEPAALVTIVSTTGSTPQRVGAKMLVFGDGRIVGTIGGGHVGFHLARVAHEVGFRVHVIDDREKFANAERFPTAAEVIVDDIPSWIGRVSLPSHAYAVIVTRGHTNDLEALRALAPRELRYLGLIGSRAKVARIYDALAADRMPADTLKRVHAPIGLDIGAVTPQEIAVSILAELIAVKHGKTHPTSMRWTPSSLNAQVSTFKS